MRPKYRIPKKRFVRHARFQLHEEYGKIHLQNFRLEVMKTN